MLSLYFLLFSNVLFSIRNRVSQCSGVLSVRVNILLMVLYRFWLVYFRLTYRFGLMDL